MKKRREQQSLPRAGRPRADEREIAVLPDEALVRRIRAGEAELFAVLMERNNQRLYRAARAILRDDAEAEDVVQDAYVRAYLHLDQFAGRARFSTWLTRIAVREAWARMRRGRRALDPVDDGGSSPGKDPEREAFVGQVRALLQVEVDALPASYRLIWVLREVEEMSTAETAAALGVTEGAVRVRLHRARALLARRLLARAGSASSHAFRFAGARCERSTASVLSRLDLPVSGPWRG